MTQIKRKCAYCHDEVFLEKTRFVFCKKQYFHYECFVEKLTKSKKNVCSLERAIEVADKAMVQGYADSENILFKEKLYKFIQQKYDINILPSFYFRKLQAVFSGEYKTMKRGIPPEDLLDMWKRKSDSLDKTYMYNRAKGNSMDRTGRINYDLAILLSMSDSYYDWKEKQKIVNQIGSVGNDVMLTSTPKRYVEPINNNDELDLASYLEEI